LANTRDVPELPKIEKRDNKEKDRVGGRYASFQDVREIKVKTSAEHYTFFPTEIITA
jgi:hypothetical protein